MRFPLRAHGALCATLLVAAGCSKSSDPTAPPTSPDPPPGDPVPPEVAVGERLFREPRFARFFAANAGADLNEALGSGDPRLDFLVVDGAEQPGPFAGSTLSCASCHLTDQGSALAGGGPRSFTNFSADARTTERADGVRRTARNVPSLLDVAVSAGPYHADGEYATLDAALEGALLGRKLGWLADERAQAVAHLARVVREDDGTTANGLAYGSVPYADLFDDAARDVPPAYALPDELRLDVAAASDEELVDAVAKVLEAYLDAQRFGRDLAGNHLGSPYDAFLAENGLPRRPAAGESDLDYARRLAAELDALASPVFVDAGVVEFETHDQDFAFGALELEGLRTFLREPGAAGAVGNCVACHAPPRFTDDLFHNTGVSQADYDAMNGAGTFLDLAVPTLAERDAQPGLFLPASPTRPLAPSALRHRPRSVYPDLADLGLWNVFANPLMPDAQAPIRDALVALHGASVATASDADLLPLTEGLFRTPSLRNLGHSNPYGHSGGFSELEALLEHYRATSDLARQGLVRNGDAALADIELTPADLPALAAFLRSLNEDVD